MYMYTVRVLPLPHACTCQLSVWFPNPVIVTNGVSSCLCVLRESLVQEGELPVRTDILEPLEFDVIVTRHLTPKLTRFFPEISVLMELTQIIEVCIPHHAKLPVYMYAVDEGYISLGCCMG